MSGGEKDLGKILKKLIAHPNIASKRWVVKQYDHEVQGGAVIKPFVGEFYDGPSDAAVYRPFLDSWKGFAVSNGINPLYGEIDPYWMAANVIDEALRNFAAVGGDIKNCAILDNFCWGNVNDPEILGGLVRASQGCYDFSTGFGVPFISGKDSLNNTWKKHDGTVVSIPATLLISAIGVIEDVRKCVTMDLKNAGNSVIVIGHTKDELGGSHFNLVTGAKGGEMPKADHVLSRKIMVALHAAINKGLAASCHDVSEGGIAVSLAEMCIAGNLGASVGVPSEDKTVEGLKYLFSESAGRFMIEAKPGDVPKLKKLFGELPFKVIGKVEKNKTLVFKTGRNAVKLDVGELKKLWTAFSDAQEI